MNVHVLSDFNLLGNWICVVLNLNAISMKKTELHHTGFAERVFQGKEPLNIVLSRRKKDV